MAKMIDITVKTLDSQNHLFTVSEELTVREFKQEILPQVAIPVDQQRLIFRGRVLQDDKKIAEYNVASNTVHLVQRPVQPPGAPRNDEPQRNTNQQEGVNFDGGAGGGIIITAGTGPSDRNAIIMGTIAGEPGTANQGGGVPRRNSAAVRLQVGNEMLNRASNLLQRLEEEDGIAAAASSVSNDVSPTSARDSGSASPSPMEVESEDQDSFGRMIAQVAHAASAAALVAAIRQTQPGNNAGGDAPPPPGSTPASASSSNTSVGNAPTGADVNSNNDNSSNRSSSRRPEAPRLRELAIAVQDLLAFQDRLTPFLNYIQHILRENMAYDNTSELQSIQYVFDSVSSILHLMGHSYHAYSDLMCDFAIPPETRRLRASSSILVEQSTVVRATIPLAVPMGGGGNPWGFLPANFTNQTAAPPQQAQGGGATGGNSTPAGQPVPSNADQATPSTEATNQQQQQQRQATAQQATQGQGILHGLGNQPIVFGNAGGNLGNHPGVSINIQANAGIPDFASLLGPAMGMGVGMPAALTPFLNNIQSNIQRGTGGGWTPSNQNQTAAQQASQQTLQSLFGLTPTAPTPPPPNNSAPATNPSNVTSEPNSAGNQPTAATAATTTPAPPNANANNANAANANNIFGNLQRNDLMRPPFDMLLSCHSHHNSRSRQRNRPNDLHRYVNLATSDSNSSLPTTHQASATPDFFETLIDYLRCSNLLIETQPMLKDWIQGYLMRGRDTKNIQHVRTCSRSMAKKLLPFFQSFTDRIPNRNEDVIYPDTYSNVVANFYTSMIQHVLQSGPTSEYRSGMLSIVEEFLMSLFSVFAISFPDSSHVPEVFANCILDEYFGGMSLVFRAYGKRSLVQYFSALSRAESANESVSNSPIVYRRPESEFQDAVNDSDGSFKSASGSDCAIPNDIPQQPPVKEDARVDVVPENKPPPPPPTFVDADMDDDDVLDDLTLLPPPVRPPVGGADILRHLPNEWTDTVRLDMRRQLGMPEQPPFSQGFCTLFPRKH